MTLRRSKISVLLVDDDEQANLERRRRLMAKLSDEITNCFIATTKQDVIKHLQNDSPTIVLSTNAVLDKTKTYSTPIDVERLMKICRVDSGTSYAYMGSVLMPLYFSIGKNRLKKRMKRIRHATKRKAKKRLSGFKRASHAVVS